MRVNEEKGVTVPSQKRYIYYFEQILKDKIETPLSYPTVYILELVIHPIPTFSTFGSSCTPTFTILNNKKEFKYSDINKKKTTYYSSDKIASFYLKSTGYSVSGDVLITFFHLKFLGKDKMFKFWFNTYFLEKSGILKLKKK